MADESAAKRPKYDTGVIARDLLIGLKGEDKDHVEWINEGREYFEKSVKNGKASYGEIRIVACKTLRVLANIYTREIFVELKNSRPDFKTGAKGEFTLRLTLEEFEGFQKQLKWIEAFTLKVGGGQLGLSTNSDGVSKEKFDNLGFERKITENFSILMKFKSGERASSIEFRKGFARFGISAGGIQFYIRHMSEKADALIAFWKDAIELAHQKGHVERLLKVKEFAGVGTAGLSHLDLAPVNDSDEDDDDEDDFPPFTQKS